VLGIDTNRHVGSKQGASLAYRLINSAKLLDVKRIRSTLQAMAWAAGQIELKYKKEQQQQKQEEKVNAPAAANQPEKSSAPMDLT
jgi:hypothetical protein